MDTVKQERIKTTINPSIGTVTWHFTQEHGGDLTVHLERIHETNRAYAALHGLKQRGADRYAIERNEDTGRSASMADKRASLKTWIEWIEKGGGEWEMRGGPRQVRELTLEEKKALFEKLKAELGVGAE